MKDLRAHVFIREYAFRNCFMECLNGVTISHTLKYLRAATYACLYRTLVRYVEELPTRSSTRPRIYHRDVTSQPIIAIAAKACV